VAGIVLAAILVPQGMAYAELAGLPPVNGLYTTIACLVGYAVMGPSKILVLGPDSALGPLIFAAIIPLVVAGDDPATAIALAGMLAIIVGLIEIGLGAAKLGFVADLLSSEVQVGYMNGLAVVIIVGQLPKLSGFSTDADSFVEEVREFVTNFDQRDATALTLGLITLAVLLVLPRLSHAIPAVLVAVVGATVVTAVFDLDVRTVGTLPKGLPTPTVPWTGAGDIVPLLVAAVGIVLVSLTDTIALSTSFNARRGERVKPNQEMIGVGSANIAAGFFQGFAVSSSSSRTAVAEQSGAKSQLTGIVGAGVMVLLLVFFNGLLADLPNSALAAVVIAAALSLLDFAHLSRLWRVRRSAVLLSLVSSAGVIFLGVLEGIVVAVVLSILLFFEQN
jgi:MFS superfamily sulfate permease-like transporter